MKSTNRMIILGVFFLATSCAVMPTSVETSPWQYPDRRSRPMSAAENLELIATLRPCIEWARSRFDETLHRYEAGQPGEAKMIAKIFDDDNYTAWIWVREAEGSRVRGSITRRHFIGGKVYKAPDSISFDRADVVDWYVIYRDRPPEGNVIGRYLLSRQDGLVTGDCDPFSPEFLRYRHFARYYSFIPPGTDGWEMRGPEQGSDLSMQEKGETADELNTLSIALFKIPGIESQQELNEQTRSFMGYGDEEGKRYLIKKHEVDAFTKEATLCALSQQLVEDKKALLSRAGKRATMMREVQTLVCLHPAEEDLGVVMQFTHRYHPGNRDEGFPARANEVFESLAFTRIQAVDRQGLRSEFD